MRWKYIDPSNPNEADDRNRKLQAIDSWWTAFQSQTKDLVELFQRESKWDLADWMSEHLGSVHPHLMWEYGPAVDCDGHRLVITPESHVHLRPLTTTILEQAPSIEGWEFYGYRLPEDVSLALQSVEARTNIDASEYTVSVQRGRNHRIDLCYYVKSSIHDNENEMVNAAFVLTESLLGEYYLDTWVGAIEAKPLPKTGLIGGLLGKKPAVTSLITLDRLRGTFGAVVHSIKEQLPPKPLSPSGDDTECSLWELTPPDLDEYPEQSDLFVARSVYPEMWQCAHTGVSFASKRFSRAGETFCYLKIDGSNSLEGSTFNNKSEIEDVIDTALTKQSLGCCVGGGTGRRYSYIDLAITDLETAIVVLREVLQKRKGT